MRCDRTGAALAFVILLMLGLLALAHGVLVTSLSELAGSRAAVRHLEARAAAERGLRAAMAVVPGPWMDSLDLWDTRTASEETVGRVGTVATLRRLGSESWLVQGSGRIDQGPTARAAQLAWSLDPLTRIIELPAIVSLGAGAPATVLGEVGTSRPDAVLPPAEGACDPWMPALTARYIRAPPTQLGTMGDSVTEPALGLLNFADLRGKSEILVSDRGTPAPEEAFGACLFEDPWNWGDPLGPTGACGSHLALRASPGDLRVEGGAGQGVLIVAGDLTLTAGARYYGLPIVSGVLRLEEGAILEGMALAAAGVQVASGSEIRGSACWAVHALFAQRELLSTLVPLSSAGRLGPL